jgi:hypothetical protein
LTVVSGQDIDVVLGLLEDAADAIDLIPMKQALVFDSLSTFIYPQRWYIEFSKEPRLWEYVKITSAGTFVVLVGNEFDPDSQEHNPRPTFLAADVVRNLMDQTLAQDRFVTEKNLKVPLAHSRLYGIREIFPFVNNVYFYDTNAGDVQFIKTQNPIL